MNFNFVNVTFVQTIKSLFNMKSRLLVLRSLKKPVPRVQLIDVSFHDSAKISWMSKTLGKPWKNNIQMPAEHSTQLSIRNPKWRRHRNHCGFLCACSLKTSPNRINHNLTILSPWAEPERFWSCWDSQRSLEPPPAVGKFTASLSHPTCSVIHWYWMMPLTFIQFNPHVSWDGQILNFGS